MSQVPGGNTTDNNANMATLTLEVVDASFTTALAGKNDRKVEATAVAGWAKFIAVQEFIRENHHRKGLWMDAHSKDLSVEGKMTVVYKYIGGATTVDPYADAAAFVAAIIAGTTLTAADVRVVTP